jgi:type I restriction-modification system DNA methylase subunit
MRKTPRVKIENWRDMLARNIAIRNENLSPRELNFAVQRTIDRLIFLRICEDRGIEDYGRLLAHLNGENVYKRLCVLFREADERYNSGLFHFREEKGREETPDDITLMLDVDDKVLKQIIQNLYYPDSPYEFSVLPADILGQVYEQFLGKVIRLTAGHQAKVEDKPEVKKAGGVFYTPTYIVDYIVKNTVGKLLEDKSPKQAAELRILDPACGSGSFLIGAYQYLLDWHCDWYTKNNPEKWLTGKTPAIYKARAGDCRLTTPERKKILLNNIYGVDIDTQAVEVTKLSLLLKVLEGENEQSIAQQLKLFHERALPDLGNNVKCGNSLITTDFYEGVQETMTLYEDEDEERMKVNAFDWDGKDGFQEIMKNGGFDAVIGNPPYVRSQFIKDAHKVYFSTNYEAAAYQPDTFAFFVERGNKLLNYNGRLGFIIPNGILTNTYYSKLREYLLKNSALEIIVDLKSNVFANAAVDTSIFILSRKPNKTQLVKIGEWPSRIHNIVKTPDKSIRQADLLLMPDFCFNTNIEKVGFKTTFKIRNKSVPLSEFFTIKAGMKVRKEYVNDAKKDKRYKKFLLGSSIKPFLVTWDSKYVCYDKTLESNYTNQAFRDEVVFLSDEKIFIRQVMGKERIHAAIDRNKFYVDQTIYVLLPKNRIHLEYYLGLICSKLVSYYFSNTISDRKQTFPKIKGSQIEQLPIRSLNLSVPTEKSFHDKIVALVTSMSDLHKKLLTVKTAQEKTIIQRQIDSTDRRIDELVYELYGLTQEEIKIVEGDRANIGTT